MQGAKRDPINYALHFDLAIPAVAAAIEIQNLKIKQTRPTTAAQGSRKIQRSYLSVKTANAPSKYHVHLLRTYNSRARTYFCLFICFFPSPFFGSVFSSLSLLPSSSLSLSLPPSLYISVYLSIYLFIHLSFLARLSLYYFFRSLSLTWLSALSLICSSTLALSSDL